MKLVERDIKFFSDLYFVKYINSKRVAKMFGDYRTTMRRLQQLEINGYIKIIDFLMNREIVWCLTKKACNIINKNYYQVRKTDKLNHALACADFYFYLRQQNYKIEYYSLDEEISFKYQGKKHRFRPDVILKIDRWYFIEIDLSNKRFEEKVSRWESYYHSGQFVPRFEIFPPIIIVSSNVGKVQGIVDKVKTIDINYAYRDYESIKSNEYKY